jgi:ATP-dependent Clp protease ATP-binding subunit ClpX
MENILLDTMFEMPSFEDIEEVIINKEVVEGRAQPLKTIGKRLSDASSKGK